MVIGIILLAYAVFDIYTDRPLSELEDLEEGLQAVKRMKLRAHEKAAKRSGVAQPDELHSRRR
jgi:hypothetical protein